MAAEEDQNVSRVELCSWWLHSEIVCLRSAERRAVWSAFHRIDSLSFWSSVFALVAVEDDGKVRAFVEAIAL